MSTNSKQKRTAAALAAMSEVFTRQQEMRTGNARLSELQAEAFARIQSAGLPGSWHEDWRYTSLTGFAERSAAYLGNDQLEATADAIESLLEEVPLVNDAFRIVFTNGSFQAGLSSLPPEGSDISISFLSQNESLSDQLFAVNQDEQPLPALNTAFITDGLVIEIPDNKHLQEALHIIYLSDGQPTGVQTRSSIRIGKNSHAKIIEHHISAGDALTNAVTRVICGDSSKLDFTRLQTESEGAIHFSNQAFNLHRGAQLNYVSVDDGAELARKDLNVKIQGEGAHAGLSGLLMSSGKRHVDNHIQVDHLAPNTTSTENYRAILGDSARGVFNGKIIVHPGADGTDAQMSNRNLLLSDNAEINTKPELEIYTDDVKCAHGSTTGQLDRNALFYLRARGLSQETARKLLVGAFAQEIVDQLQSTLPELVEYLTVKLHEQLNHDE
ncbi:MAG: Fe-S cluster assembly protein SufD [Gammaproteobacteria bacterium]|nr:Fe-S cluster assembly protein SufD [Gammaproteobacteria bacterium]